MTSKFASPKKFAAALLCSTAVCPVLAQTVDIPRPPSRSSVDERGVDAASGALLINDPQLSIGTSDTGLSYTRFWPGNNGWRNNYVISMKIDSTSHRTVTIGDSSTGFTLSGGVYVSDKGDGATLAPNPSPSTGWTYVAPDGTSIDFSGTAVDTSGNPVSAVYYDSHTHYIANWIKKPTGQKIALHYESANWLYMYNGDIVGENLVRLQSVTNSNGFQIKYNYADNSLAGHGGLSDPTAGPNWVRITNVTAINNGIDYCDPLADTCNGLTQSWPSVSYSTAVSGTNTIESVTDEVGRVTQYITDNATGSTHKLIGMRRPSSPSADSVTYGYDANGRISSVAVAGVGTWNYNFSLSGTTLTASITTPSIPTPRTIVSDATILQPTSITDENGYTSSFTYYYPDGHLKKEVHPEGNFLTYTYDSRGNLLCPNQLRLSIYAFAQSDHDLA